MSDKRIEVRKRITPIIEWDDLERRMAIVARMTAVSLIQSFSLANSS